jgi:hypothetical protein
LRTRSTNQCTADHRSASQIIGWHRAWKLQS